jgi:hypothetical protein
MLEKKMFSEFMRDHLLYFTKETLETTLRLNGFEVIECKAVWHDYILSATVQKRSAPDLSPFNEAQRRLTSDIDSFIRRHTRVAVWGAGHQSFAILSLTGISDRIRYVIDSAPFKQGKFTPATHIPIVAPSELDRDPVDAVIIMAGSYSDEVARTLRKTHGARVDIAIVRGHGLETGQSI